MADFSFLKNPLTGKTVISAPRRAKRMDVAKKAEPVCPFCIGKEGEEEELFRITKTPSNSPLSGGENSLPDKGGLGRVNEDWAVRVIPNKFPFTPHHEIVILSPDHHKGFDELPFSHLELIFKTYRQRYNANSQYGQPYIFHNGGFGSGESIPHPHTQIAVVPYDVQVDISSLDMNIYNNKAAINSKSEASNSKQYQNSNDKNSKRFDYLNFKNLNLFRVSNFDIRISALGLSRNSNFNKEENADILETESFLIFCPKASEWPDEVWVAPRQTRLLPRQTRLSPKKGLVFGDISDAEITDLSFIVSRLIQIFDLRHGHEFPFNFYIYPGENWYFRLIPRLKVLGGFEVGTGVMVNTQNPAETLAFIKEHLWEPDLEKIRREQQADYLRSI